MALQPEEPAATGTTTVPLRSFADALSARIAGTGRHPAIVALDGRGGAGKSTLAAALADELGATVIHTDDIAWNEPLFEWGGLLRDLLGVVRATGRLHVAPPAWVRLDREGAIVVPEGCRVVLVEGTGASQRAVNDLVDAAIWVQADDEIAEARGIARDVADGQNGDEAETIAFWHEWMAAERRFFAADRPWQRADWIVSGTPGPGTPPGSVVYVCGDPRAGRSPG